MTRTEATIAALRAVRFFDTAHALEAGERVNLRGAERLLRWAIPRYVDERVGMAKALKCVKALRRERRSRCRTW